MTSDRQLETPRPTRRKMSRTWCPAKHSAVAAALLFVSCFGTATACSVTQNGAPINTLLVHTNNTSPEGTVVVALQSTDVSSATLTDRTYITLDFSATTGEIKLLTTKAFEEYEVTNIVATISLVINYVCTGTTGSNTLQVNVQLSLNNKYAPVFISGGSTGVTTLELVAPSPLPRGYSVAGGCERILRAIDYGLDDSSITFAVQPAGSFAVTATSVQIGGKPGYELAVTTAALLQFEQPLVVTLTATDGGTPPKSTDLTMTLTPDVTESTPPSPWFSEAVYSAEVTEAMSSGDTIPFSKDISITEGYESSMKIALESIDGTDWSSKFSVLHSDKIVQIRLAETPTEEFLMKPFLALVLKANRDQAVKEGRAVVLLTLPGSKPATTTTSTTITTTSCPTTVTETTTPFDCSTCPTSTSTTQSTTTCFTDCSLCTTLTTRWTTKINPPTGSSNATNSHGTTLVTPNISSTGQQTDCSQCPTVVTTDCPATSSTPCPTDCAQCPAASSTSSSCPTDCSQCPTVATECPVTSSSGSTSCPTDCSQCPVSESSATASASTLLGTTTINNPTSCPTDCSQCPTSSNTSTVCTPCPTASSSSTSCPTDCSQCPASECSTMSSASTFPLTATTSNGHTSCPTDCSQCPATSHTSTCPECPMASSTSASCPTTDCSQCPAVITHCPATSSSGSTQHTTDCSQCPASECSMMSSASTFSLTATTSNGHTSCPTDCSQCPATSHTSTCPECPTASSTSASCPTTDCSQCPAVITHCPATSSSGSTQHTTDCSQCPASECSTMASASTFPTSSSNSHTSSPTDCSQCPSVITHCPESTSSTSCPTDCSECPAVITHCPATSSSDSTHCPTDCSQCPATECSTMAGASTFSATATSNSHTDCSQCPVTSNCSTTCPQCPIASSSTTVYPTDCSQCPSVITHCPATSSGSSTECPTDCSQCPVASSSSTSCPTDCSQCPSISTDCPTTSNSTSTSCPTDCSQCPVVTTSCPISCPTDCSECQNTGCPISVTECPSTVSDTATCQPCPPTVSISTPCETDCSKCTTSATKWTTFSTSPSQPSVTTESTIGSSTATATPQPQLVKFNESLYEFSGQWPCGGKSMTLGEVVATVVGGEGDPTYSIEGAPDSIKIDKASGSLSLERPLVPKNYIFKAVAEWKNSKDIATVIVAVPNYDSCTSNSTRLRYVFVITDFDEESAYKISSSQPLSGANCSWTKTSEEPPNRNFFSVASNGTISTDGIDREDEVFSGRTLSEVLLQVNVTCDGDQEDEDEVPEDASDPSKAWYPLKSLRSSYKEVTYLAVVNDINDNSPQFTEGTSLAVGYPDEKLAKQLMPQSLLTVHATDKDVGLNAYIRYEIVSDGSEGSGQFVIHPHTGTIYPSESGFKFKDTSFKVVAKDQDGAPGCLQSDYLTVQVRMLSSQHLTVLTVEGRLVEDTDSLLQQIHTTSGLAMKVLSSAVLPSSAASTRSWLLLHLLADSTPNSLLRLVAYALNATSDLPVPFSGVKQTLDGSNLGFKLAVSELPETSSSSSGTSMSSGSDTGLVAAVATLGVLLALSIAAILGVTYFFFFRRKRGSSEGSYDNIVRADSSDDSPSFNDPPASAYDTNIMLAYNEQLNKYDEQRRQQELGPADEEAAPRKSVAFSPEVSHFGEESEVDEVRL